MKKIVAIIAVMFGISMFAYAKMSPNQNLADASSNPQMQDMAPANDAVNNKMDAMQNQANETMKPMPKAADENANDNGADGDDAKDSSDDNDNAMSGDSNDDNE